MVCSLVFGFSISQNLVYVFALSDTCLIIWQTIQALFGGLHTILRSFLEGCGKEELSRHLPSAEENEILSQPQQNKIPPNQKFQ